MIKIIYSSNIPDDTSNEYLWLENIPLAHKETAQAVCNKLNERLGDNQCPFYYIVEQSKKLYVWEP